MNTSEWPRPSARRRWLAVILATVIMMASYLMFVLAFAAESGGESVFGGGLFGIALGLVPAVFIVAAFVSVRPNSLKAGMAATGLWLPIAGVVGFLDLPTALVASFGVGGIVAFRRESSNTLVSRAMAVGLCATYTFVLQQLSPVAGLFAGAPLPFVAIALADVYTERAAEEN